MKNKQRDWNRIIRLAFFISIIYCSLVPAASATSAELVNLCGRDMYIREGFDLTWIKTLPSNKQQWLKFDAQPAGRKLRISEMNIPGKPHHSFLSFKTYKPETFTFVTSFIISEDELKANPMYGLYLSHIGINWEIYVNGKLIRREMYIDPDGTINVNRSLELILIPVDVRILHEGENILGFRIVGDPSNKLTGFYRQNDYFFGSFDLLENRFEKMKQGMLVFFYCIVGLFSVFVFTSRLKEKYFLFYGLMTLTMAIYIFARSPLSYSIFFDSRTVFSVEQVSLFMVIPMIGAMFDYFIFSRLSLFTKIYAGFCVLCSLTALASPVSVDFDILLLWQASSIVPILYYPVMIFIKGVIPDYRIIKEREQIITPEIRKIELCGKTMFSSYAALLLLGIAIVIFCSVADIIDAVFFSKGLLLTQYGIFGFTISIGLIISKKFNSVQNMLEHLNTALKVQVLALNDSNSRLALSEEKYRFLVDYSADYIFLLNIDGSFLSANNSLFKRMRIRPEDINSYSFMDLVYAEDNQREISIELVKNSFSELASSKKKIQFRTKLKSPETSGEPGDYIVMIEYAHVDGHDFILGKASSATEDNLIEFFKSEHQKYVINNYLLSAEQMSQRIARNAGKYISQHEADTLRIVIREIIINAIEHGNLGITYAEKSEALDNDRYFDFIKERQTDPKWKDNRIEVEYSINEKRIICKVTDDGAGFDYIKFLRDHFQEANDEMLGHGRGLSMAENYFDEIKFNRKGNQILMMKKFSL